MGARRQEVVGSGKCPSSSIHMSIFLPFILSITSLVFTALIREDDDGLKNKLRRHVQVLWCYVC